MPRITDMEKQKRNHSRYSIYLDGTYAFGVHEEVVLGHRLQIGKELTDDFIKTVLESEEVQRVLESAIHLLSFRSRSEQELRKRLKQKDYEDNWIEAALLKLKSYGYVDDESFARMFAKDRQKTKKLGTNGIKAELKQKGIAQDTIKEIVEELYEVNKELEQAIELCEKKVRILGEKDPLPKRKQKIFQFLIRKGYSFDIANQAIAKVVS